MENGWMDWIEWMWKVDVESGKWRGSGSHTGTHLRTPERWKAKLA